MTREEIAHCPTCGKESHLCLCPTINRGSFAKYVDKREEIRKVIDNYTDNECLFPNKWCECHYDTLCVEEDESYKCLMKRLGELDVIIELKKEPPKDAEEAWERIQEFGNLSVVEPLIKE